MTKAEEVLALERAALDRWGRGDPGGCLEICAPDVTYFDPAVPKRSGSPSHTLSARDSAGRLSHSHSAVPTNGMMATNPKMAAYWC